MKSFICISLSLLFFVTAFSQRDSSRGPADTVRSSTREQPREKRFANSDSTSPITDSAKSSSRAQHSEKRIANSDSSSVVTDTVRTPVPKQHAESHLINSDPGAVVTDSASSPGRKRHSARDLADVFHSVFHHERPADSLHVEKTDTRLHLSLVPAAGYTLQTGFAGIVSSNLAYYADTVPSTKMSSISTSVTYSQYNQIIIPLQMNLWTKRNKLNLITDIRYISYPSDIYGLGGRTDPNKGFTINFSGLKIHQTIMKSLSGNVFLGLGYYYDRFWDIKAIDRLSRSVSRQLAKELGKQETASGLALRFLYDSRLNQINPQQGAYYNITYRTSMKSWGSDSNWQALQIDTRGYFHFPQTSRNVLALWMFDWLTAGGTPPYLLLPSTGWDDNYNTGRGYIQGRFRGRNMLYFETEYRFGITANGLLGGVIFGNVQNFSSDLSGEYNQLFPGYGLGVRLKLNKHSGTNLAVDYGFGQNGSRGFFVNLGEVF